MIHEDFALVVETVRLYVEATKRIIVGLENLSALFGEESGFEETVLGFKEGLKGGQEALETWKNMLKEDHILSKTVSEFLEEHEAQVIWVEKKKVE